MNSSIDYLAIALVVCVTITCYQSVAQIVRRTIGILDRLSEAIESIEQQLAKSAKIDRQLIDIQACLNSLVSVTYDENGTVMMLETLKDDVDSIKLMLSSQSEHQVNAP